MKSTLKKNKKIVVYPKPKIPTFFWWVVLVWFGILGVVFVSAENTAFSSPTAKAFLNTPIKTLFSLAQISSSFSSLIGNSGSGAHSPLVPLLGQQEGRTNFMLYGLTLDGNRTDTMMLVSYFWKENTIVTLNIPRDLYATYKGYTGKIVSLYAVAKAQKSVDTDYPPKFVNSFIEQEYGIPVHYYAVINMNAFRQLIDTLGGLTIHVEHTFTDYKYPTDNYSGYIRPAPHFGSWDTIMDGNTALIYARSRHSLDASEGTDFARQKRQQQVIGAMITKMKEGGIFGNLTKLWGYISIFNDNILTNLTFSEITKLAQIGEGLDLKTEYKSMDWNFDSGFICDSNSDDGQSILLYGIPGNCFEKAGGTKSASPFKKKAVSIVQNLLQAVTPTPVLKTQTGSILQKKIH